MANNNGAFARAVEKATAKQEQEEGKASRIAPKVSVVGDKITIELSIQEIGAKARDSKNGKVQGFMLENVPFKVEGTGFELRPGWVTLAMTTR